MFQTASPSIAIIDDFHPVMMQQLQEKGISFTYNPEVPESGVYDLVKHAGIVAVRSKIQFDRDLIAALPELRCIARGGAGMDNIDEAFAIEHGITLLNAPEGNRDAVAEHVVGLLLSLSKNIYRSAQEVRNFEWRREANRGWEIGGKTLGIIGFGNTGSSLAKKLSGFDCRVIAYDKYARIESPYATQVELDVLLGNSDIISLHTPLNAGTAKMVNGDLIARMKDGVVLINSSRGKIVDTREVLNNLKTGKIRSFATDVLENEDFRNLDTRDQELISELYVSGRVIITPHIAGWSTESYERIANVLVAKLIDFTTSVKII